MPETIRDMSGNPLAPLEYRIADEFAADTIGPRVVGATLDLTAGMVILTFSETVRTTAFNPDQITLLSSNNTAANSTTVYRLTGGIFNSGPAFDSTVVPFDLTPQDLLEILARDDLAISIETSFILYTSLITTDLASNVAETIPPFQVTEYIEDEVNPNNITFLELDLSLRQLVVEFNEPVDLATADASLFILQEFRDNVFGAGDSYTLTGGSFSYRDPDSNQKRVLVLQLNAVDYRTIVLDEDLATSIFDTFLALPSGAAFDFAGNPLTDIPISDGRMVVDLIPDFTTPELLTFDLDIDSGLFTFEFDNVMNPDTLDGTAITIQDAATANVSYTLTGGSTDSPSDYTIDVQLTPDDLNEIKRLTGIATSNEDTYLTVTASLLNNFGGMLIEDIGGIGTDLLAITDDNGIQVRNFTPDTTDPILEGFDLDLDANELILTFSETVNASSLVLTEIVLQNTPENASTEFVLTTRGAPDLNTVSTQLDSTVITIALGFDDMNDIRRLTDLAINSETTYILFPNITVFDMFDNPIEPVFSDAAQPVSTFTEDMTSPELVEYSLDVNTGLLFLTFTETVNVRSLDTATVTLQSEETGGDAVSLTTSFSNSENDYIVLVNISTSNLNEIKRFQQLAQSVGDTYLFITSATITDMNSNTVVSISPFAARQVSNYTEDVTNPNLVSYHLDMNNGVLHLTFDETVDVDTLQFTELTFFSNTTDFAATSYNLSGGMLLTVDNTHEPSVQILPRDQYSIKLLTDLATAIEDTYLVVTPETVLDTALAPNSVNELAEGLQADNYTADTTPPELLQFTVNLNLGLLSFIFDEPVNVSSISFNSFTLQSENSGSFDSYQLTDGATNSSNGRFIELYVTDFDLNMIKRRENLFVSGATSFLSFMSDAIRDMADNGIIGRSSSEAIPTTSFTEDTTRPLLLFFDLDMNDEVLTLYFSETVDYTSLNISGITLQQDFNVSGLNDSYRLTDGIVSPMDNTTIMVQLTTMDVNQLKTFMIGVTNTSVWLSIDSGSILDQNTEPVIPRVIPVQFYTPDTTPPQLVVFSLDLNLGILWLTFSESVDSSSFNSTSIALQNAGERENNPDTYFTFSPASQNWVYDIPTQRVTIGEADLNEIKRLFQLATTIDDTYLTIDAGGIDDVFGNPVVEINASVALQADDVIPDSTPPVLVCYSLNLTSEVLVLTFNETVNASSLYTPSFQLLNETPADSNTSTYQLTTNSTIEGGDLIDQHSTVITIQLGASDLNEIKFLTRLAVSNDSTYLAVTSSGISDMNGNALVEIPTDDAQPVKNYFEDVIRPNLVQFDLDMNLGLLTLIFSETVNASSLQPVEITVLGEDSNSTEYVLTLAGARQTSGEDSTVIEIYILDSDLNEIKRQRGLATNDSNTYLSITEDLINDMNLNPVVTISETNALPVRAFTNDTTSPLLLGFDLNLTSEILTLTFSETVRVDTLDVTQITLQNGPLFSEFWMLADGVPLTTDDTVVSIRLQNGDLNQIKNLTDLATNGNNTYISVTQLLIQDMNSNNNDQRPPSIPIQATEFVEDMIRPELASFDLDMDGSGLLTLSFSETVNVSSLDVTQITLLMDRNVTVELHSLSSLSYPSSPNGPVVEIQIHMDDLNRIKMIEQLAVSRFVTFISISEELVLDMNDNPNVEISAAEAMQVASDGYTSDTTDPTLQAFGIDLNEGLLMLTFSETVFGSSISRAEFTIQNASNLTDSFLTLEQFEVSLPRNVSLVLPLTVNELNELKRIPTLATSITDTWISVNLGVTDIFGNPLEPIVADDALQASEYISDTTSPNLDHFDIDLDAGTLTLVFDETVRASSFNITQITLQGTPQDDAVNTYTLTGASLLERTPL